MSCCKCDRPLPRTPLAKQYPELPLICSDCLRNLPPDEQKGPSRMVLVADHELEENADKVDVECEHHHTLDPGCADPRLMWCRACGALHIGGEWRLPGEVD